MDVHELRIRKHLHQHADSGGIDRIFQNQPAPAGMNCRNLQRTPVARLQLRRDPRRRILQKNMPLGESVRLAREHELCTE